MGLLSETDKKIAELLLESPKTVEDIAKALNMPLKDVQESLKKLVRLRLVYQGGYPPKFFLSPRVKESLKGQQSVEVEGIRVHMIIEVQSNEELAVKRAAENLKEKLSREEDVEITKVELSSIEKTDENTYSAYLEVELGTPSLTKLVELVFLYGPSVIEVEKPDKIEIDIGDLQDALNTIAYFVHGYSGLILRLMSKRELEDFTWRLLRGE